MYGGSFLGRKKLGRFLAPFDTKKGAFQIQPITNTEFQGKRNHCEKMENIFNNPGLQHLAENILLNLNFEDLKKCQLINQSASNIIENPMFWLKKLIPYGVSKENQNIWIKFIQSETNFEKKQSTAYLKNIHETYCCIFGKNL